MPQLLYFAYLLSPSYIRSQNIVCRYGEDVHNGTQYSHVQHIDTQLNIAMRTISGTLRPTNINWLPVLSNIEPPHIRRDHATLQEYKKAQQLTDRVPIKEILREPPMSRLRSRRPFVIEAARLANLNQADQETWEQSWIQGIPPGHDLVTNPTSIRHFESSEMSPGQMRRISLPMGCDRITCLPLRREPPDYKAHC